MAIDCAAVADRRRCDECGYLLTGLDAPGVCPECGVSYTEQRLYGFPGWRDLLLLFARLTWPIAGLAAVVTFLAADIEPFNGFCPPAWLAVPVGLIGLVLASAIPILFHVEVRRFLQGTLPPRVRRRAGVVVLRRVGTVACVVGGLALLLAYCLLLFVHGLAHTNMG